MVQETSVETVSTKINPVENRERFEECHDQLIRTWTTPGPVPLGGQALRLPRGQPVHPAAPPVWVPGTTSPETAGWASHHGYTYLAFLTALDVTEELFAMYRNAAAEQERETVPDTSATCSAPLRRRSRKRADEEARHFIWRMGATTRVPREYMNPVGYRTQAPHRPELRGVDAATMSNIGLFGKEILPVIRTW